MFFVGISNSDYGASVQIYQDEHGIPYVQNLMPDFPNAHEIVEDIKNKLHGYGLKNNMVDIRHTIWKDNRFGTVGNAK